MNIPMRIPGSRPFRPPSQKEKPLREQSWDNRFHLGKIPDYNSAQDKYIPTNKTHKTRKKILLVPGKIKKPKPPTASELANCVSVKGLTKPPLVQSQIIHKLTSNLISAWTLKGIPQVFRDFFLKAIEKLPAKEKSAALVKEVEMVKSEKSLIQIALRAVQKREESLKELVDFAKTLEVATNNIKHNWVENLINLRVLTLLVVESIQAWRVKLKEYAVDEDLHFFQFVWENSNYLVTVQNDLQVFQGTLVANFIEFLQNDPFLVHCKGDKGKIDIPIEAGIMKRIRDAENVLKSEGMKEVVLKEVEPAPKRLNECRSSRLFLQEETKKVVISRIEGDIEEQIMQYSLLVPEFIQNSMGKPETAYTNALGMRFPAFLWGKIGKEIVSLITLNLENQKSMHKRLYISHFSFLQTDMIEKLLEILVDYIWATYDCIEIRIGIISRVNEQGKYEADKSIKQHFDKIGFRWKQMIYTVNETPVQLLGLRRPEGKEYVAQSYSIFDDCIEMAYACVVQLSDTSSQSNASLCSIVGLACAVKALGKSNVEEVQHLITKMAEIPPAFRFRKDLKIETAIKDLSSVKLAINDLSENTETAVSCSALGLSWIKYFPSVYKGIRYTRVLSPVNVMKSESKILYIVSTEDPQYSVFLIPERNTIDNPFEYARKILKNIERNDEAEEIWVPSFCVEKEHQVVGMANSEVNDRNVGKCVETFRFKINSAMHPLGSPIIEPAKDCLIIDNDFIFGMMHHKIDEQLEVPLFVIQVTSMNFLK